VYDYLAEAEAAMDDYDDSPFEDPGEYDFTVNWADEPDRSAEDFDAYVRRIDRREAAPAGTEHHFEGVQGIPLVAIPGDPALQTEFEGIREELAAVRRSQKLDRWVEASMETREEMFRREYRLAGEMLARFERGKHAIELLAEARQLQRELRGAEDTARDDLMLYHYHTKTRLRKGLGPVLEASTTRVVNTDDDLLLVHDDTAFHQVFCDLMEKSQTAIQQHRTNTVLLQEHAAATQRAEVRPVPCLESEMDGSKRVLFAPNSALCVVGGAPRGAIACPVGSAKANNDGLMLYTHRHAFDDHKGHYVDSPYTVGSSITVWLAVEASAATSRSGKILSVVAAEGEDLMRVLTDISSHGVARAEFGKPKVGAPVTLVTASILNGTVVWTRAQGSVTHSGKTMVCYTASTEKGDCGFPVVQADGKIIAMHLYGRIEAAPGGRANAGMSVAFRQPPKVGVVELPSFTPNPLGADLQGVLVGRTPPQVAYWPTKFRMKEGFKTVGLRTDKDLTGLIPKHHVCKPSTAMCHAEIGKYHDDMQHDFRTDKFLTAVKAAVLYDLAQGDFESPFVKPTHGACFAALREMKLDRSAGATAEGLKASEYLLALGAGDEVAGMNKCAERVMRLYNAATDPQATDDTDKELLRECGVWNVIGKKDGYKIKKTPIHDPPGTGRTIQAPCLELKVLWKVCFGENDTLWLKRADAWVHAGEDEDLPLPASSIDALAKALGAFATDMTAFDRYQTKPFFKAFFMFYLKRVCPGAPPLLLWWLYQVTACGPLLLTDGTMYSRDHGNPSGFMNTLRLNCIVHLVALAYVVAIRLDVDEPMEVTRFLDQDCKLSICGDDSGHLALTERALEVFDLRNGMRAYLDTWDRHTPWPETKLEGMALFKPDDDLATRVAKVPPMVGRKYVLMHGIVFAPLLNVSRTLKRISSAEKRSQQEELDLVNSAYASLALHLWWQSHGWYYSPAVEYFWREYHHLGDTRIITKRVAEMYRGECRQGAGW